MAQRFGFKQVYTLPARPLFFDANVLIYIFWPTGSNRWAAGYSSLFAALLKQNKDMIVDIIVISEVINRTVRIEYEKYLQINLLSRKQCPFKTFRDSCDGKEATHDVFSIVANKILPWFRLIGKVFSKGDIESFLTVNILDFSDKAICFLCKENNCILLTNDKDFAAADVDILSLHPDLEP